jgi:hypothetical protein
MSDAGVADHDAPGGRHERCQVKNGQARPHGIVAEAGALGDTAGELSFSGAARHEHAPSGVDLGARHARPAIGRPAASLTGGAGMDERGPGRRRQERH